MHVVGAQRDELNAYQLKSMARTWFPQWKEGRVQDARHPNWAFVEEVFLGVFFPEK